MPPQNDGLKAFAEMLKHFCEAAAAGFSRGGTLGSLRLLLHTASRKVSFVTHMSSQMTYFMQNAYFRWLSI
jgi:selenophosphate synthetase-related protein